MQMLESLLTVLNHPTNRDSKVAVIPRLVWWKLNQWWFHFPTIVSLAGVVKLVAYPDSASGSLTVYVNLPEYHEMHAVLAWLGAQDTFIDVGANIGDYSLLAATKISTGQIYSFEPLPVPLERFRENIALNNFQNRISVDNKVVTNRLGSVGFESKTTSEESGIAHQSSDDKQVAYFPAITLDAFLKSKSLRSVKLIKIDVEGAELAVLQGAQQALQSGVFKIILIELNSRCRDYGTTQMAAFQMLEQYAYQVCRFTAEHELAKLHQADIQGETMNVVAVHSSINLKELQKQSRHYFKQLYAN